MVHADCEFLIHCLLHEQGEVFFAILVIFMPEVLHDDSLSLLDDVFLEFLYIVPLGLDVILRDLELVDSILVIILEYLLP